MPFGGSHISNRIPISRELLVSKRRQSIRISSQSFHSTFRSGFTMIQNLLMQLLLGLLVLATVTTATDDIESASSHRRFLQTCNKKDRTSCPGQAPDPGSNCCFQRPRACSYGYSYQWTGDCTSIQCVRSMACSCTSGKWLCAASRRKLSAINPDECADQIDSLPASIQQYQT